MISLLALGVLWPQDLLEREKTWRRRLGPDVEYSDVKPRRAAVEVSVGPDFACDRFDVKASFRSLFDRNVREEFLGGTLKALQAELAGSALVLACYASPTVCDAIKHYRVTAQTMLGSELDACRALEQSLEEVERRSRARAIKECLEEKAAQGVPLDRAREECRRPARVRGLDGRPVEEIDLLKELGLPDRLVPPFSIGAGTMRAESRATAVVEAFEARRRERLELWERAVRDPGRAPLDGLGPVSRAEVERVAALDPGVRQAVLRSLASAAALADLVREAHEAERALEGAELLAAPELRAELERRRAQLRHEIGRLLETFEAERRFHQAVAEALAAADAETAGRAAERLAARRAVEIRRAAERETGPWGCDVKREGAGGRAR